MNLILATVLIGNLVVAGTAPTQGVVAGCGGNILQPLPATPLTVVLFYVGPIYGLRFATVKPGARFIFVESVPPGSYLVQAWAQNGHGTPCDTTITESVGLTPTVVTN